MRYGRGAAVHGQLLVNLFGDERHDGVQQAQRLVEHEHEVALARQAVGRVGGRLPGALLENSMYQSQNSFQKNAYSSRVASPNSKVVERRVDARHQPCQAAENTQRSAGVRRLGLARLVAVQVHRDEAGGVAGSCSRSCG